MFQESKEISFKIKELSDEQQNKKSELINELESLDKIVDKINLS